MNANISKFITFMAGSTIGALSAIVGIAITTKMLEPIMDDIDNDEIENSEMKFFTEEIKKYLADDEHVDEYIDIIENTCKNFQCDYRVFLVTLYEYVITDNHDQLINILNAIKTILDGYTSSRYYNTKVTIDDIISGNYSFVEDTEDETDSEVCEDNGNEEEVTA